MIFAHGDSAGYGTYREWWRAEAKIADGVLTIEGKAMLTEWLRSLQFTHLKRILAHAALVRRGILEA